MKILYLFFLLIFGPMCVSAIPQQSSPGNRDRFAGVNARGDQGMGLVTRKQLIISIFSLTVALRDTKQRFSASQKAIRQHLSMIAIKFYQGDFAIPMFIHATVPPGVETMERLKSKITYEAENTVRGAQLRITTHDTEALAAIHSFLSFQIHDHQTGDSLEVQK